MNPVQGEEIFIKCVQFHSRDSGIHTAYWQFSARQDKEIGMSGQMNSNINWKKIQDSNTTVS